MTETTLCGSSCVGAGCRQQVSPGRSEASTRLCTSCTDRIARELVRLPDLYVECGRQLGGSNQLHERTSGGPLPGMPFNAAAADVRSAIVGILASWAALVAEKRGVTAPRREVKSLASFLIMHLRWLSAFDAAKEFSAEIAQLARDARRIIDPDPLRRLWLGSCIEAECAGNVVVVIRTKEPQLPTEVSCSRDRSHRWLGHEWLQLSRQIAGERGTSAREAAPARWLTAAGISRLWGVTPGSIYRHASKQRWRRQSRAGRTYYHELDVARTLGRHRDRLPR